MEEFATRLEAALERAASAPTCMAPSPRTYCASRTPKPTMDTTPAVAICDVSVDFISDLYDANSAALYDANLDANM